MDEKRLILVFPPFAVATSPPLGVSSLKSYILLRQPEWDVKIVDLNLAMHQHVVAAAANGQMANMGMFNPYEEVTLLRAAETFKGQYQNEFFAQPARYSLYADMWLRLAANEVGSYRALQQAYRQGGPFPALLEQWAQKITSLEPAVVGFSVCYTQQLWMTLCLAALLRRYSQCKIVFGGTYFNRVIEGFLAEHHSVVDLIISGEGELALAEFLRTPDDVSNIPGASYLKDNQLVINPPQLEDNLDLLGFPDYSDLDLRQYYSPQPVVPIFTSRGCYWRRCAFCVHYKSAGQTYRKRTIAHVIAEIERHYSRGVRHFALIDEMIAPTYFEHLADAILQSEMKIYYYALAKPVKHFSSQLLAKLFSSGCCYLIWGVESGAQRLLDLMNKGTNLEDMAVVLRDAATLGIYNHTYVMAGFPTETADEFQQTLDFLQSNRTNIAAVHKGIFHLEHGSPVFENPTQYQITNYWPAGDSLMQGWYEFECSCGMSRQEVRDRFNAALPMLRDFNPYSRFLGNFRDHALLIYSHMRHSQ